MDKFTVGDSIMAGFRLIRREPLAFLAWSVVYGVVGLAPQFFGMMMGFEAMTTLRSAAASNPEAITQAMAPIQRLQPISLLASVVSSVLLSGAVYRAVLFPDDRRFLYLRLGGRELWMALTFASLLIIAIVGMIALVIPVGLLAAAAGAVSGGAGALLAIPAFFVVLGVFIWGAARLSLAAPLAFAERSFRIPEAWKQTRGYAGRIFLVMLGLVGVLLLVEILLFALGAGVFSLFMPLSEMGRLFTQNPAQLFSKIHPAAWVLVAVLWALFGTWSAAMFSAPLAEIYRSLRGPDHADVFS
jgi:hypothetical protein